ncbi:MAG TPA: putative Ig domain-containing protein, partial [Blastocatellia bacterium]|nr:putative Ig domain-containing protein [Blastocatellia bacterium]
DAFGFSVALDGDTLVVGSSLIDIGANLGQGSAYVFTRSGAFWTQQQKLIANDGAQGDAFGFSVALDGDTLVAGAFGDDLGGNIYQGSAYVFTRSGAIWIQQQKLIANDGTAYDYFGSSVTADGDTVVVGAFGDNVGAGSAYIFTRSGAIWTQQPKLIANDGAPGDSFGSSVALNGDTLVVSAVNDTFGGNFSQGSVYVNTLPTCPTLSFTPASLPNGIILFPYQHSVTVSGGIGPYQFALISGALPPGISMTSSGFLSGTPTTPGFYQFTIIVTDLYSGCSSGGVYTLTIASCPSITITTNGLPDGAMGSAYSQTLAATGGSAPYSFTVGKTLPSGLSLSQNGVLSGAPTTWGVFDFTVNVTDASGCAGSRDYTLNVALFGGGGGSESSVAPRRRRQQ